MGIQVQLGNGALIGGGLAAFKAANVHAKPLDYGSFGHYRVAVAVPLVASQGVNSRLFELRNSGANLIIPTLVEVEAIAVGDVGPDGNLWIAMHNCTNFSAVDTANTVTPSAMVVRPTGMSAAPGGVQLRVCAGNSAGMTGGTLTKDAGPHSYLIAWMSSASAERPPRIKRFVDPADLVAAHPPVYATNQGLVIENAILGSATDNNVYILVTVAWAEVLEY